MIISPTWILSLAGLFSTSGDHAPPCLNVRATIDRPDDTPLTQLRALYVLPSDGVDQQLDVSGAICTSIAAAENWLWDQSGGRTLRLDTYGGAIDVGFVRLGASDAEIAGSDPSNTCPDSGSAFVRDRIESALASMGVLVAGKIYAVYYGGSSSYACGGGADPASGINGQVAAFYLKGRPGAQPSTCDAYWPARDNPSAGNRRVPTYVDYAVLHDLVHTLGLVAPEAPHQSGAGHVHDSLSIAPRDLMYRPRPGTSDPYWDVYNPAGLILDINHDDYFQHGDPLLPDLARSPLLSGAAAPSDPPLPSRCGALLPGQGLAIGFTLSSCDGRFTLGIGRDGTLALDEIGAAAPRWAISSTSARSLWMQPDGDLVLFDAGRTLLWSSRTAGNPGASLSLGDDGDLSVLSSSDALLFESGTGGALPIASCVAAAAASMLEAAPEPPPPPTALAPSGGTISASPVALSWAASPSASSYLVQVNVWNGSSWVSAGSGTPAANAMSFAPSANPAWYNFMVQAKNAFGTSAWSASSSFYYSSGSPPPAPAGLSPNGATLRSSPVTLSFGAVAGASSYAVNVYYWNGSSWVLHASLTTSGTSIAYTPPFGATWYEWIVDARNAFGSGPWSSWATFYRR